MITAMMIQIMKTFCLWLFSRLGNDDAEREKEKWAASVSDKKRIAQGVRRFFDKNYELRYNTLKQTEEFRPRRHNQPGNPNKEAAFSNSQHGYSDEEAAPWRQLTDRELHRMAIEQMAEVGVAWSIDVECYVRSTLVTDYNPVADYLAHLEPWDGTDRIRLLARRVPCATAQWPDWFHRWMLAMVAQWQQRSRRYGNALVPLLIGPQGTRKSTFCRLLLPPELREYYIDDIKLDSAEQVERMLARMLLVNIDEYNAKTDREQAKIKRVLTERDVQTRRMRSDQYQLLPRMASFIATTNDPQPLGDPTGSRRYLCCDVAGCIDTDSPIDYRQLYAQAVAELDAGCPWHFSKDEECAIERHNASYRAEASAESILLAHFEPAPRKKENFLRATDIQGVLCQHLRPADVPSIKKLALALRACHFSHGALDGRRGWYARPVSP